MARASHVISSTIACLLFLFDFALADVTLEVVDVQKGIFRVTYEIVDTTPHAESFLFPLIEGNEK